MANIHDQISKFANQSSNISFQETSAVDSIKTKTEDERKLSQEKEKPPSEVPPKNEKCEQIEESTNPPCAEQIGFIWS